ncbi:single-stranded DNA-binding protein [Cellulomonas alba]|uniref:Single-stranded DNA-binding protein n=1 Tax=Cellulomonas alba TaxID=3053467 RepID=A0ABT7SIH4_9CELL|nr:single-stranded DNA-binding protein [Cellulomonas alba]MDM7855946.1 single-stranded DNA-binding protein [Cellulomonas alba]
MSKNDVDLTVAGVVGSEVRIFHADDGGTPFAMFRMAHTARVRDAAGGWRDGETLWFTVKVFRQAARNAAQSLRTGDAVLVHGRLSTEEWTNDSGSHFGVVLTATSFGHDLTRGTAHFARTSATRSADGATEAPGDGPGTDGQPVDLSGFVAVDDDGEPDELEEETDDGTPDASVAVLAAGRPALAAAH